MVKIGVLSIIMLMLLVVSVSAISKYYSPIVTGQDLTGERVDPTSFGVLENLILGTTAGTSHRTTFNTCQFAGSGDSDYRYANVDDDGLIYLTDDDFINIFDDDCTLIATHTINGTLHSQPFVFDSEGDGFKNIFYISVVGFISQINEFEIVNGILISPIPNQFPIEADSKVCFGLYCDRSIQTCATFCDRTSGANYWNVFDVNPRIGDNIVNISSGMPTECSMNDNYDEVNDQFLIDCGANERVFQDRTYPAFYGMDIDKDNNIEAVGIIPCGDTITPVCMTSVDLTDRTLSTEVDDFDSVFVISSPADVDVQSSAGFSQVANFGSLESNGEIFIASTTQTSQKKFAGVYNSVASIIKIIIDFRQLGFDDIKMSNFAVSDIDGDLKNDYCISFNDTARDNETKIHCYSGLTNSIMTNCTISGWSTDNPIHISLLGWDTISIRDELITTFGIFDLSTTNGDECVNLRPDGFTGLTSASEGVMLPVAIGGDTISGNRDTAVDLLYYGADGARLFKTQTVSGVGGTGTQFGELCGAPHIILCDDFNYEFGLTQRGWQVLERDGEINTSITPINNRLNSTDVKFQSFVQESSSVTVNYTIPFAFPDRDDERILTVTEATIILDFVHPVVSHSFKLNIQNNNGDIEFRVDDRNLKPSIQLIFNGTDISYKNESSPIFETILCDNCLTPNVTHSIKVTQFFGKDNEKEQGFSYPFNVSVEKGFYRVFVDNVLVGDNIFFTDNASTDFSTWIFTKDKDIVTGFTLDDVFSYRGTSQIIDNSDNFFNSLLDIFACQQAGNFCTANSQCCSRLSCLNNECQSETSELITDKDDNAITQAFRDIPTGGLGFDIIWYIIMFVVGIAIFVGVAKTAGGAAALGGTLIAEIFLLILGTALGFVPVGIIIIIVVVGLVITGLFVRKMISGTPN